MALRFDGKVALITGAGNGLGREYALEFARRGAKVVVNDLGGSVLGDGASSRAADDVVNEIRGFGGTAVANYDSVEYGEKVVKTALDAFGRIDIVVNNAGILRDRSLAKTDDKDWDLVHQVHLRGSFLVSRAAWPHMKKQQYGRIIMTSSTSGLYGSFGQSNYSAAKLGCLGLANAMALEGSKYNIHCNTIIPTAGSRLSASVMPQDYADALKPAYVAPLVVWLCHQQCDATKGVFETGAGWVAALRWQRSQGINLRAQGQYITVESVRDAWAQIEDFSDAEPVTKIDDTTRKMVSTMEEAAMVPEITSGSDDVFDPSRAMQHKFPVMAFDVTPSKLCLYAVSVGCDPYSDDHQLKYTYENASDFTALPTFAVIPAQAALGQVMAGLPGLKFNPMLLLHGEQMITLHQPYPTEGRVLSQAKFVDILDKQKGALVLLQVETKDTQGNLIATNDFSLFIRGKGGFGGPADSNHKKPLTAVPTSKPDYVIEEKTQTGIAAVYRLNGDVNPLHIDPAMAKVAGFNSPILHGLCTYAIGAKHVLQRCLENDPARIASIQARFASPVFPGETLRTDVWKTSQGWSFRVTVVERNEVVLSHGLVTEHGRTGPSPTIAAKTTAQAGSGAVFATIGNAINPKMVNSVKAVFQFQLKQPDGTTAVWTVDLKNGSGAVAQGPDANVRADTTLKMAEDDFVKLASGQLNAMQAFMQGKLKISGNMMLAQKLQAVFEQAKKTTDTAPSKSESTSEAAAVFDGIRQRLNADLVRKVQAVFAFELKGAHGEERWIVDLKNESGQVLKGPDAGIKADTTLKMAEDDFVKLASGQLNAMQAFMKGKLKISGNMMLAQKLQAVFKSNSKL
eukprot:TRINITY_DN11480_c0_g4_i1.p1 TRINITY_DN11480_c0_g4~~TRINITY_DN11480_c0_g4_i1.p1  ORF type:complete len:852 (+),score=216.78 TRINITY_DN11480_c0_g4_i1:63-2618(+)